MTPPTPFDDIAALDADHVMGTYARAPVAFVRGEGSRLWDSEGREYLDFLSGIAVTSLGHAHPAVVDAVTTQVARIAHTSNLYANEPAVALAERLAALLAPGEARVFLCNDGTTANEAALKVALRARPGRRRFVATKHLECRRVSLGAGSMDERRHAP